MNDRTAPVPAVPAQLPGKVDPGRAIRVLVGLAAATIAAFGMHASSSILGPTLLALIIVICVSPVRSWLERRGTPKGLATVAVLVTVLALVLAFVGTLVVAVAQFSALLPQYAEQMADIPATIENWLKSLGVSSDQILGLLSNIDLNALVHSLLGVLGSTLGLTSWIGLMLMVLFMMVIDTAYFPSELRRLRLTHQPFVDALDGYTRGVRSYMVVAAVFGAIIAVLNTIVLLILDVPGALLWGLLAFITNFIPTVGYWIAVIPAVFFAWLSGGFVVAIVVFLAYTAINFIVQTFVQPRFVGSAVAVSQTFAFLSLVVWAVVLGPIGAVLGIPLTLLVRALLVDADPNAQWMRPLAGDFSASKKEQHDAASATRVRRQGTGRDRGRPEAAEEAETADAAKADGGTPLP